MALTNEFGFSIGGYHSENFNIRVYDIKRNVLPELTENLLNIPARKGSYFTGLTVAHRVIQVDINIVARSHADRLNYIEGIAYWLLNNADADQEIIFDDALDRVYYGHIANSTQVVRGLFNGKATIEIHCSDPYAYGASDINLAPDNDGLFTVDNSGSAQIYPVFTTNFANPASFISYIAPNGIILLGNPADATKVNLPVTQYILNDNMLDLTAWTSNATGLDSGRVVSGSASQLSTGIGVSDYGSASGWHGPAIKRTLPSTVQDFTVKAQIQLDSKNSTSSWDGSQIGAIDIYLFDANNSKIGKLTMSDSTSQYEYNVPRLEFNNGDAILDVTNAIPAPQVIQQKDPVYYTVVKGDNLWSIARRFGVPLSQLEAINGKSPSNTIIHPGDRLKIKDQTYSQTIYPQNVGIYNNFQGQLTLQRIGTTWYAEVKRTDSGSNTYTSSATYYDVNNKYSTSPLAYVVINLLAYDTNNPITALEVDSLQVIQNNTVDDTHNETLFQSGDELVVDCTNSSVWLNGDLIMDKLDIGSTFFPIQPGTSEVKVLTDDTSATHSCTYTPRFL